MATQITAAMVKELREKTGAGMMECKSALTEANGDLEESIKVLRKKGLAAAGKKAGRITSEGLVQAYIAGNTGVLVEMNSETDFVAQNAEFRGLVQDVAKLIAASSAQDNDAALALPWPNDPDGHNVSQVIAGKIATIGENLSLRRFARYETSGALASYIHGNGKIGVLVEITGGGDKSQLEAVGKEIAMHIAAAEPRFLHRNEVTDKDLETEREIARDQALKSGKPEAVVDKIVSGKMEKFYGEAVLLEQPYVRDDKQTITQLLAARGKESGSTLEVKRFVRFKLGEGLQKREEDFAAEVAAQAGL